VHMLMFAGCQFFSSSTSRDNNFSMLVKDSWCAKIFFFASFETQLYIWCPTLHFANTICSKKMEAYVFVCHVLHPCAWNFSPFFCF
jgi:hypothetical protein